MFTPSLVSMMWHSLRDGHFVSLLEPAPDWYGGTADVAKALETVDKAQKLRSLTRPEVPVVGWGKNPGAYERIKNFVALTPFPGGAGMFIHGRVPAALLVEHFKQHRDDKRTEEYLDLGTPLSMAHAVPVSRTVLAQCRTRMALTDTGTRVRIAFIDGADAAAGPPDDFGGKLHHAVSGAFELSAHAVEVLGVLLERLDTPHGMLGDCEMHCALVHKTAPAVGLVCFEHDTCVELLDAITVLDGHLGRGGLPVVPVVTNLSLGTHVGPHDGNSPIEEFIAAHFPVSSDRPLFAAAGNDGLSGRAASRDVLPGVDEHLRVGVGSVGSSEVLIELWWEDADSPTFTVEIEVSRLGVSLTSGSPVSIGPGSPGVTLTVAGAAGMATSHSLFHALCRGGRSCAAFALSAPTAADLSDVDIDITLRSATQVRVNAWLVICDDQRSAFVTGAAVGSIRVPATEASVVSVTGVTAAGQPWGRSARGPTAVYGAAATPTAPYLAHRAHTSASSIDQGTSFASPRACADAAALFNGGATGYTGAQVLAQEIVNASAQRPAKPWDPRTGFGAIWT